MKKIAIGVLALVALAAGAVLLLRSSDEQKIEKMLRECADAAERGDAEGIIRHLDPSCTLNGSGYALLCERLRREVEQSRGVRIETGVSSQVAGEAADVQLHVRARAAQHVLGETDVRLKLKKTAGEWRIAAVEEVR